MNGSAEPAKPAKTLPDPQPASDTPRPPVKKLSRHVGGPSIKSALNGGQVNEEAISTKEQHELYNRPDLTEAFTNEQLQSKWKQYLSSLEDRPNLKSTLSREPELRADNTILLRIDNHVQDDLIKNIKPQLVSWLRRELKNSSIDLVTEVNETEGPKIVYTDGEKFEEMLRKNPDLAYLKQRFNLDFEG